MKNRILKALASFGLSVCVLAGSSVVSMAEETPGKTECKEHTWKTTTEYKTECVETTFQHKLPDGTTETLTLCPECGKIKNNTQLTKVNGVFSNFSNLTIHTGTLKNGEQVMTAAFYYPTVIERVICEKCGPVKSEEVTPARVICLKAGKWTCVHAPIVGFFVRLRQVVPQRERSSQRERIVCIYPLCMSWAWWPRSCSSSASASIPGARSMFYMDYFSQVRYNSKE